MAMKKEWNNPTETKDDKFEIVVTTLAPMVEMTKGNTFKETGKGSKNSEYKDIIRSDELVEGMTIVAEDDKPTKTKKDKEEHTK